MRLTKLPRVFIGIVAALLAALISSTPTGAQQGPDQTPAAWLDGKWRGPAPGGGIIVIDIKVVDGEKIVGTSHLESRSSYEPEVSGKVSGDKVTIILTNPRSGNNARFDLTRSGDRLNGTRKGQEVVFEKSR